MQKITYKCPGCGSDDIVMDATAKWNNASQAWEFSDVIDYCTCQDCFTEDYPERFMVTL